MKNSKIVRMLLVGAAVLCVSGCASEKQEIKETVDIPVVTAEPSPLATVEPTPLVTLEVPLIKEEPSTQIYQIMYVVNCHESITLRTNASTSASEICQIPLGAAVSYVETAENGFYKVIYNGKTGYALGSYLNTTYTGGAHTEQPQNSTSYSTMYVVNCNESITLRKKASTSAGEICQIPLGAAVSYVEAAGNGFYKVIYNGKTGYALASYLSYEFTSSNNGASAYYTMYVVNCNESITLRTNPSTSASEICQIPLGASVSFVEVSDNGFYKVIYNGKTGYALASYLE